MKIYKSIGIFVTLFVVLASLNAIQFAKSDYTIDTTVSTYNAYIKYMARDNCSETAGASVLYREDNTSGAYKLKLGKWHPEFSNLLTASFALVNEEGDQLRVNSITVTGTGASYINVYVHGDPTKIANQTIGNQMSKYDSSNISYVENGVSQSVSEENQWVLAGGDANMSSYKPNAAQKTCTWDTTYYVWRGDYTETTAAVSGTGDTAYIEIDICLPASAHASGETTFNPSISIFLAAVVG